MQDTGRVCPKCKGKILLYEETMEKICIKCGRKEHRKKKYAHLPKFNRGSKEELDRVISDIYRWAAENP